MPTATYTPLATVTLAAQTATITFSNIPATYRDLIFVQDCTVPTTNSFGYLRFNGDASGTYVHQKLNGSGTGTGTATTSTTQTGVESIFTQPIFGPGRGVSVAQIMDYSATDKHKTVLVRYQPQQNPEPTTIALVSRWPNTAAITSITHVRSSGVYEIGSVFSLYGIIS
jgi:hypothetical protein